MGMRGLPGLCAALALAACAPSSGHHGKGLVAFSQAGMENEWRVMNTRDMEAAFRRAGYDFVWTNANADPAKQLADIEDLTARNPVLLVVEPIEYEPLAPIPSMAADAGVPLIVADRTLPGTPGSGTWIGTLTTNFVDTGEQTAKDVVAHLTVRGGRAKGVILHITGNTGASPVVDEQQGLDKVLHAHPDIHIGATCDGSYSREGGRKCTEDLLQAFAPGKVDGIVYDSDDMLIGGIQAIKAAGRKELLGQLWGKDGTVEALNALLAGEARFTVQTPPTFGIAALKMFEDHKAGRPIQPKVQFVPNESFGIDTPAQRARLVQRIAELHKLGVGCC